MPSATSMKKSKTDKAKVTTDLEKKTRQKITKMTTSNATDILLKDLKLMGKFKKCHVRVARLGTLGKISKKKEKSERKLKANLIRGNAIKMTPQISDRPKRHTTGSIQETDANKTPERTSVKSPARTPNKSPEKTPNKSPEKTPNKSLEKTPNKSLEKTPDKSPEKTENQKIESRERKRKAAKSPENNKRNKEEKEKKKRQIFIRLPFLETAKLKSLSKELAEKRFSKKGAAVKRLGKTFLTEKYGSRFFRCHVKVARYRDPNDPTPKKKDKFNRKSVSFVETVEVFGESDDDLSQIINSARTSTPTQDVLSSSNDSITVSPSRRKVSLLKYTESRRSEHMRRSDEKVPRAKSMKNKKSNSKIDKDVDTSVQELKEEEREKSSPITEIDETNQDNSYDVDETEHEVLPEDERIEEEDEDEEQENEKEKDEAAVGEEENAEIIEDEEKVEEEVNEEEEKSEEEREDEEREEEEEKEEEQKEVEVEEEEEEKEEEEKQEEEKQEEEKQEEEKQEEEKEEEEKKEEEKEEEEKKEEEKEEEENEVSNPSEKNRQSSENEPECTQDDVVQIQNEDCIETHNAEKESKKDDSNYSGKQSEQSSTDANDKSTSNEQKQGTSKQEEDNDRETSNDLLAERSGNAGNNNNSNHIELSSGSESNSIIFQDILPNEFALNPDQDLFQDADDQEKEFSLQMSNNSVMSSLCQKDDKNEQGSDSVLCDLNNIDTTLDESSDRPSAQQTKFSLNTFFKSLKTKIISPRTESIPPTKTGSQCTEHEGDQNMRDELTIK